MELQRLADRAAGRSVCFDLLKQWISNTFHRQVQDTCPAGCSWQSLSTACRASGCHIQTGEDLETTFRTVLVQTYASFKGAQLEALLEAKLADELSFFHCARYSLERAKDYWKWYLYCLTFHSRDFSTDGQSWNKYPRSTTVVARIPLDTVDLALLAKFLNARITVSRLNQPALRLPPASRGMEEVHSLHVVVHKGLWAPVLSTLDWVSCRIDRSARVGSVVEIHDNVPSHIEGFAGLLACVNSFDEVEGCYTVCNGLHQIPLHSTQIRRVLSRSADLIRRSTEVSHDVALGIPSRWYLPGEAPALRGIPDSSLEFQLLLQMVLGDVGRRLRNMRERLAGRPVRDEPLTLEDPAALGAKEFELLRHRPPTPGEPCPSCLSLPSVEQLLKGGARIWTRCPGSVNGGLFHLNRQDFVCLVATKAGREDGSLLFQAHTSTNQRLVEIPGDSLCLWMATQDFDPPLKWRNLREFLQVWQGESLIMIERHHKWDGWGKMRRLEQEDSDSVGLVALKYLVPYVWVGKLEVADALSEGTAFGLRH